ncbi:MAG: aminotransferase class V-fold PLP-dependent enzyme [Actinobacteria bacterium]|nr:aminotransferase class V-fold PLP-dependent enzyme [Actinomycetota bacterium]
MSLDIAALRKEFPMLQRQVGGKPIHYLDNANSSHKPNCVIDTMSQFMREGYAPIGRSSYTLASEASTTYEAARAKVAHFINARSPREVVFTKNATESLNLAAQSWGRANLGKGDVVVLTHMEHHANIVPWQMLAAEKGVEIRWVPLTADFQLDLTSLDSILRGAKVFAFTSMSNVLGTINPVRELCDAAHRAGAIAVVDGCQSVPHMTTDVQAWGADMLAFSSHKMCGPTGVGVFWAPEAMLDSMPPFLGGGGMISDVRLDSFTCAELPAKFEAGTPPIVEVIGLGAAVDFLSGIGMSEVRRHEIELTNARVLTLVEFKLVSVRDENKTLALKPALPTGKSLRVEVPMALGCAFTVVLEFTDATPEQHEGINLCSDKKINLVE